MKRSRVILVGVLALGLAGSVAAAAKASEAHPRPGPPATVEDCPGMKGDRPGMKGDPHGVEHDQKADKVEVKDGKVFFNGKEVASIPATDGPMSVAVKDGKVYVGKDAEALPVPAGAHVETRIGGSASGPVRDFHPEDGRGPVITCASEIGLNE